MFNLLSLLNLKFLIGFINNKSYPNKLSNEEEEKYINELFIKEKAKTAREKLILHNLRLVSHIASKYESKFDSYEDLISIGTIGLIKAIDSYSLSKSVKLATYASKCIENEILMVLRSNKKHSKNVSLSDNLNSSSDDSDISLIDTIPSDEESLDDVLFKKQRLKQLSQYINLLDEREYQIISLRYGLNNNAPLTQKEISTMYDISRSYVSRIEKRALSKLLLEFKKHG